MGRQSSSPQFGFTLIELLVVVAILSIVASLTLSAVMRAREAARKVSCANNLRQIGSGLYDFESRQGKFPGSYWGYVGGRSNRTKWSFSPSSLIAAELGGQALADSVKLEQPLDDQDPDWEALGLPAPGALHCPGDSYATAGASSYRYCRGNIPQWPKDPGGSFVDFNRGFRIAAFSDGLATTAFASERLISRPTPGWPDHQRDLIMANRGFLSVAIACVTLNQATSHPRLVSWSLEPTGTAWMSGRWLHNAYYHLFPPNSQWSDCRMSGRAGMAVITARSTHETGVNVLFGDGHVDFVSNTINQAVWHALATRAGMELVSGD
jgi:prepilin-type N-terminal cleavage/methylation domain-containing protein/prepilin-type processing-associated H-X9-DG protein